jgi:acyl-CoA hydrolase
MIAPITGRPVQESRSVYTYVALPNDANPLGNVLGGRVMHLVDMCGCVAALRHARRPVVTAAVDEMSFLHPVAIGQLLVLRSSVNRVFRTSMEGRCQGLGRESENGPSSPYVIRLSDLRDD